MKNILLIIILFVYNNFIFAEEHHNHSEHSHHIHHNHIALFSGATSNLEHKSTDLSLGIDYEHRFSFSDGLIGIGLFGETVFAEHTELLAGIPIFLHPIGNLKFLVAPSIISYEEEEHSEETELLKKYNRDKIQAEESTNSVKHNDFLIRIGTAYDIHFGNFSFTPTFNVDIHSGKFALVNGFSIGYGF